LLAITAVGVTASNAPVNSSHPRTENARTLRNFCDRQARIRVICYEGRKGHGRHCRFLWVLNESRAAALLDYPQPRSSITVATA
jgi:hypothetical protein